MANDLNNAAKLTARIQDDARRVAENVAKQAKAEAEKVKELADHDVQEVTAEFDARAQRAAEEILERSRTNAQLDSRKYTLAAKRKVIDKAFADAYDALCRLEDSKRDELFVAAAVSCAQGGETLLPALTDAQRAKALLGRINEALKGSSKEGITVGNTSEQIGGGFLIIGKGYEMNCSFEAMLRDVREAEESNVAKILFE